MGLTLPGGLPCISLEQCWQKSDGGKGALSWSLAPAVAVKLKLASSNGNGLAAE